MSWVADYSAARPDPAALKAAGCVGVVRYAGALTPAFNITADEYATLQAAGLPVAVVCEQRVNDILGGRAVGQEMAKAALADTRRAKLPDGLVYAACDLDATLGGPTTPGSPGDQQMSKVHATLVGFADILGWANVGFYGSYYAIDWLVSKAVPVAAFWCTEAWSNGQRHPRAALYQRAAAPQPVPSGVDFNELVGDWKPRREAPTVDVRALQQNLVRIGWPLTVDGAAGAQTTQAVRDFQFGYGRGGIRLAVDGVAGPQTQAAISRCVAEGGHLSAHFLFREYACSHCGWIKVHWSLPTALEVYRAKLSPGGVSVVSGYRCPVRNSQIPGAAPNSQHMYGTACDVVPVASTNRVRALNVFSGIEYRSGGLVYHVDTRHALPATNWTHSTTANPSVFLFG